VDVVARVSTAAERILPGGPVRFAYLFGSAATGAQRADSDIDLAVYLDPSQHADALELRLALMSAFAQVLGREVDVVVLNEAPLPLLGAVLGERVVVYSADESARVRFEAACSPCSSAAPPRLPPCGNSPSTSRRTNPPIARRWPP
jgi:predicted nucleotidyltransferase